MNSNDPTPVKDRIRELIDRKELRMRSRAFFILTIVATTVLALFTLLLSVFMGTLVFFTLRINGHESLLRLGSHGILLFLRVFPWWLLVLDVILVILLERLLRQFQFWYRKPVLYIVLSLAAIAMLLGFGLDYGTSLNDNLLYQADQHTLPQPFGSVYQGRRHPPPPGSGIYRGMIVGVASSTISLHDPDFSTSTLTVVLPKEGPSAQTHFSIGDVVLVVGDTAKMNIVHAIDIHRFNVHGIPPAQQ